MNQLGKNNPMDKRKVIRQEEHMVKPPRLEGIVHKAGMEQIPKKKKEDRDKDAS